MCIRDRDEASPPDCMNALADAAFLSAAEGPGPYGSTAYTDAELQAMGAVGMPMQAGVMGPPMAMPGRGMVPQHLPGPGRHLQIMDHTVHRIDTNIKANGEEEKEMVVVAAAPTARSRSTCRSASRRRTTTRPTWRTSGRSARRRCRATCR